MPHDLISLMEVRHLWDAATEATGGDGLEAMQYFAGLVLSRYAAASLPDGYVSIPKWFADMALSAYNAAHPLVGAQTAAPQAGENVQPAGYIHPDNVRRLEAGETVAFRKKPYAHDGGGIHVYVGTQPAPQAAPAVPPISDDMLERVSKALRLAFNLGQIYWQQADSEYASQYKQADVTQEKFQRLLDDTRVALTTQGASHE